MMQREKLPLKWVQAIHAKLLARYGSAWSSKWKGVAPEALQDDWATELSGFGKRPEAISYAFDHLPPAHPPTVIEFASLCRNCPAPANIERIEYAATPPKAIMDEMNKLKGPAKHDPKDWARAIIARHEGGEKLSPTTLRFAKEALKC